MTVVRRSRHSTPAESQSWAYQGFKCCILGMKHATTCWVLSSAAGGAGLLAARLGVSTVVSTDSVRHMLRSFTPAAANPLLWASTYEARAAFRNSPL